MRCPSAVVLAAFITGLAGSSEARADDCIPRNGLSTCVDVDNLWVRPGTGPLLGVGSGLTTPEGEVTFGLVATYLSRPLVIEIAGPDTEPRSIYVVDNLFNVTYLLALGVTDRFEVTLAAPVTFFQDGAGYEAILGGEGDPPRSVVRDPRFGFAFAFIRRERVGDPDGFSLVGRMEFAAPLGDGDTFAGARTATAIPAMTGELRVGPLTAGAELGARIRGETELGDVRWGSQITTGLGASVMVWELPKLSFAAEGTALITVVEQQEDLAPLVPTEWMVSSRVAPLLAGDVAFVLGGGGPIPLSDHAATAPRFRFTAGVQYAPLGTDGDADGVLDRDDECPEKREDRDGFEDQDGCPDPDNDADRIPDSRDRCRDEPETYDGHQDADGCPDLDDDQDGIPDEADRCRSEREDLDRFEDSDGCPEPDNDGDGILDAADGCPLGPEDIDKFQDADGCPDPDNDADGTLDASDRCPLEREDKDGFSDADGCPDPDNDSDGVLDTADRCPNEMETLDGVDDGDGCPEPGSTSKVRFDGARVEIIAPATFRPGSVEPTPQLEAQLRLVARLLKSRPGALVIVEAYPDRAGDASAKAQELSAGRAGAVRRLFVQEGLPDDRITAAAGDLGTKRAAGAAQLDITVQGAR